MTGGKWQQQQNRQLTPESQSNARMQLQIEPIENNKESILKYYLGVPLHILIKYLPANASYILDLPMHTIRKVSIDNTKSKAALNPEGDQVLVVCPP